MSGVNVIYEVTGEYDMIVIARVTSVDMINKFIDEIRSISEVVGTNTMIVLRTWV